jgi:hypothetical protein
MDYKPDEQGHCWRIDPFIILAKQLFLCRVISVWQVHAAV